MKNSANSNMYEASLAETWARFEDRLDGAYECPVLVASSSPLPEHARSALASSAQALGYGTDACTFFVVGRPLAAPLATGTAAAPPSGPEPLTENDLFAAIEGLDPLALIIADKAAAEACARAYHHPVAVPDSGRLLGREVVAFEDFAAMLATPQEKQRAWGLLKRLPRLES